MLHMITQSLLADVARYVTDILINQLPDELYFHNLEHTKGVVNAVRDIGVSCGLKECDLNIVQIAAWFHDTGYKDSYMGHEDDSITLCFDYLVQHGLDESAIIKIVSCIAATKYPQKPQDLLQRILCDADMCHLSKQDYSCYSSRLRREWEAHLDLHYTDEEWLTKNIEFLTDHTYFTAYGNVFYGPGKLKNLSVLNTSISSDSVDLN